MYPRFGLGSIVTLIQPTKIKHTSQAIENIMTNYSYGTPHLYVPSRVASSVIRWEELTVFWNAGLCFAFAFAKCCGKQESPPTFILSNKEREKAQKNSFFEIFMSTGGRFIEREDVSTLSICGYPRALRYLLTVFSKCLLFNCEWV